MAVRRPLWRALAWAYGILFVLFAVTTGGKTYYLGAAYVSCSPPAPSPSTHGCRPRPGRLRNLLLASALTAAVAVLTRVAGAPGGCVGWTYKTNPALGESVGWPQLVRTVDGVGSRCRRGQRASAVIFTADYGEAGAINELPGNGPAAP